MYSLFLVIGQGHQGEIKKGKKKVEVYAYVVYSIIIRKRKPTVLKLLIAGKLVPAMNVFVSIYVIPQNIVSVEYMWKVRWQRRLCFAW